jgi:DNA-binding NtrC family response regulator
MTTENSSLKGKNVLIVDDEPDVLASLEDLLSMCDPVKASSFEEAKGLLESQHFDMAILDIMGVDGYKLLDIAHEKNIMAIMLTAHAVSPEDTVKSYKKGAAFFVPKEKLAEITTFLNDVLEAKEKGHNYWTRWLERLGTYYDKKFGSHWRDSEREFWDKLAEQGWRLASFIRREGKNNR